VRALPPTLIQDLRQARKDPLAPLQHPWAAPQRLHDTHPREHRLTIEERQDHEQAATHPIDPGQSRQIGRHDLTLDPLHSALQDREQAVLAIGEQVIERAP
jgi:hypothetical protein